MRSLLLAGLLLLPATAIAQPNPFGPNPRKAPEPKAEIDLKLVSQRPDNYLLTAAHAPIKEILELMCAVKGGQLLDSDKITISPKIKSVRLIGNYDHVFYQLTRAGGIIVIPEGNDYRIVATGWVPDQMPTDELPEFVFPTKKWGPMEPFNPDSEKFKTAPKQRGPFEFVKG